MKDSKLPLKCPSCESGLMVKQLICDHCSTEVSGRFPLPALSRLSREHQKFILDFIKASGSLKLMAQEMSLSYPTVRNLLDEIIDQIKELDQDE